MADGSSFTGKTLPKDVAVIGEGNAMEKPVKLFGKWDTEGYVSWCFVLRVRFVLMIPCFYLSLLLVALVNWTVGSASRLAVFVSSVLHRTRCDL
jgi:hypothetical protein